MKILEIDYFLWLLRGVGVDYEITKYKKLYEFLWKEPFLVVHPRDNNRRLDGIDLRWRYAHETGESVSEIENLDCSVLEMLVAFAQRLDLEWFGTPGKPEPERIFWQMICNLGLQKYKDYHFTCEKCCEIVKNWMNKCDKSCMIFPIERDLQSEFWEQAIHYLK